MDFGLKKLKTHRENTDKKLIKKYPFCPSEEE